MARGEVVLFASYRICRIWFSFWSFRLFRWFRFACFGGFVLFVLVVSLCSFRGFRFARFVSLFRVLVHAQLILKLFKKFLVNRNNTWKVITEES